jgi:fatty acid desaturase
MNLVVSGVEKDAAARLARGRQIPFGIENGDIGFPARLAVRGHEQRALAERDEHGVTRDCLENTRTTLTLPLVRLFAWNMPYHAEHHAYPAVPFHALPRLHARVRSRIEHVEPGYAAATVTVNRHLFGRGPGILRHPG